MGFQQDSISADLLWRAEVTPVALTHTRYSNYSRPKHHTHQRLLQTKLMSVIWVTVRVCVCVCVLVPATYIVAWLALG